MKLIGIILIVGLAVGCMAPVAQAERVFQWNGSVSTAWNVNANWTLQSGSPQGYPVNATDTAIIVGATNNPAFDLSALEVGKVFIQSGGILTVQGSGGSTATLTIDNANGLGVGATGTLNIQKGGAVVVEAGGRLPLDGNINFVDAGTGDPPRLEISQTTVIPDATSDSGDIIGGAAGGVIAGTDAGATLILGENHDITGKLDIQVALVNNGRIIADANLEDITLSTYAKTGSGDYVISHSGATLIVDAPVSGSSGSDLTIEDGTMELNYFFISCGDLFMEGGSIVLGANSMFEMSGCP